MADELEQLLKDSEPKPDAPKEEVKDPPKEEKTEDQIKAEEIAKKEAQLENINKAILEANTRLKETRQASLAPKSDAPLPEIDFKDPSAKAWDQHIEAKVSPFSQQLQQEKQEVFTSTLRSWLQKHPTVAENTDRLKTMIETYEALSKDRITGLQKDGVEVYLDKAYAAENHEQIVAQEAQRRRSRAENDQAFADVATSHSATDYRNEEEPRAPIDPELREMTARWDKSLEELGFDVKAAKIKR